MSYFNKTAPTVGDGLDAALNGPIDASVDRTAGATQPTHLEPRHTRRPIDFLIVAAT